MRYLILLSAFVSSLVQASTITIDGNCSVDQAGRKITIQCDDTTIAVPVPPVVAPTEPSPPPPPPPVTSNPAAAGSCGPVSLRNVNVQSFYDAPGAAFNQRMSARQAYVLAFRTGTASRVVQTIDIVEWSGAPNTKDVSLSVAPCDYVNPIARVAGMRPNIKFTVGMQVSKSTIRPDLTYPVLLPNTQYHISIRNVEPGTGKETCPTACGFNFKFFGTNQ